MKKIAIVLFVVSMLASLLVVGTAYADKSGPNASGNGGGLEKWVTGGCKIFFGPPEEGAHLTFAGTIGITSNGDFRGNMVVIDRGSDLIWRCNSFTSVDIVGNVATFTGNFVNNLGDSLEVTLCITDNGEPGAGVDTLKGSNEYGPFGGAIAAGNFQVHSK